MGVSSNSKPEVNNVYIYSDIQSIYIYICIHMRGKPREKKVDQQSKGQPDKDTLGCLAVRFILLTLDVQPKWVPSHFLIGLANKRPNNACTTKMLQAQDKVQELSPKSSCLKEGGIGAPKRILIQPKKDNKVQNSPKSTCLKIGIGPPSPKNEAKTLIPFGFPLHPTQKGVPQPPRSGLRNCLFPGQDRLRKRRRTRRAPPGVRIRLRSRG